MSESNKDENINKEDNKSVSEDKTKEEKTEVTVEEKLKSSAVNRGKTRIHLQLPDLSELMVKADFAIGAAGATTWERCCLGLPSILVICALNQQLVGEAMKKSGAAIVFNASDDLSSEIKGTVLDLRTKTANYLKMSDIARQNCDGLGVQRTIGVLEELHERLNV